MNTDRLTSLALKTLHAALASQWMEIVYIPVEVLQKMALWLSRQQNEDGAFIETAEHYYDRSFWVNVVDVMSRVIFNVRFNRCLHFNEKGST